eukprot:6120695-Pyramimonas_sp.AAC.1
MCKVRVFGEHEIVHIAHAVNLGHPTLDYKKWWSQFDECLMKWPPTMILGDFNAHLGQRPRTALRQGSHEGIGGLLKEECTPDEDDLPGHLMRQAILDH